MTRAEFNEKMQELSEKRYDITDYDTLRYFAIRLLKDDQVGFALHILNAIYNSYGISDWFQYDFTAGTCDTPKSIDSEADIEKYL